MRCSDERGRKKRLSLAEFLHFLLCFLLGFAERNYKIRLEYSGNIVVQYYRAVAVGTACCCCISGSGYLTTAGFADVYPKSADLTVIGIWSPLIVISRLVSFLPAEFLQSIYIIDIVAVVAFHFLLFCVPFKLGSAAGAFVILDAHKFFLSA